MISATHSSGRSSSAGTGVPGNLAMPTGVVLITPSAVASAAARSVPASARPAPNRAAHVGRHLLGARRVGVDHRELPDAQLDRGLRHRRAGAAGADLHDPVALHVGQAAAEALGEARGVGVVADPAAVAQHHRVDRAQCRRVLGQLVQQRDHRLLAGEGDVEAVEAHALGGGQQLRQRLGAQPQRLQVDAAVDVAQALRRTLLLVHGRGERALDAVADQPGEHTLRLGGHGVPASGCTAVTMVAGQTGSLIAGMILPDIRPSLISNASREPIGVEVMI